MTASRVLSHCPSPREWDAGTSPSHLGQLVRQGPKPFSLKALVSAVIEWDKQRDNPGTEATKSCPTVESCLGQDFSLCSSWDATDWQAFFDERAAMAEFDGKASRPVAEGRAFQACIVEWLNRHPPSSLSPPDRCAACGKMEAHGASIVPFGTSAHVWLHPTCWRGWHHKRITDAETALKALSIGARL